MTETPLTREELLQELAFADNGITGARQELDEIATLVAALSPSAVMPACLASQLEGATEYLIDLERRRELIRRELDSPSDMSVPDRVH
jgi:hypothetical protein